MSLYILVFYDTKQQTSMEAILIKGESIILLYNRKSNNLQNIRKLINEYYIIYKTISQYYFIHCCIRMTKIHENNDKIKL